MNQVSFVVDRTFTREYGTMKGYGLLLDLTADKSTGEPAIKHLGCSKIFLIARTL